MFSFFSVYLLIQTYLFLSFYSKSIEQFITQDYNRNEETYIVLESMLKKFAENEINYTKDEIMTLLQKDIELFPIIEIPGAKRYTIGNVYLEFDEDDNLIKLKPNPVRNLYNNDLSEEDKREIYGDFSISHFKIMQRNLIDSYFDLSYQLFLGIFLSLLLIIGIVYYLYFEIISKKHKHLLLSFYISISTIFFIVLSMLYQFYWIKIILEDTIRTTGFSNCRMVFYGFDNVLIFPTFLFNIFVVTFGLFIIVLARIIKTSESKLVA